MSADVDEIEYRSELACRLGATEEAVKEEYGEFVEDDFIESLESHERDLRLPSEVALDIVEGIYGEWNNLDTVLKNVHQEYDGVSVSSRPVRKVLRDQELEGYSFREYDNFNLSDDLLDENRHSDRSLHVGSELEFPSWGTNRWHPVWSTSEYGLGIDEQEALSWYRDQVEESSDEEIEEFREKVLNSQKKTSIASRGLHQLRKLGTGDEYDLTDKEKQILEETVEALVFESEEVLGGSDRLPNISENWNWDEEEMLEPTEDHVSRPS
ncbi:MAG: hypothetical protein ABEK10_04555 [Candidatus Nanosalina sp.]